MTNLKFQRMVKFVTKRYPEADEVFLAKKLLFLAENKGYHDLMK